MPSHHRPCRHVPWRAQGHLALGGGPDPHHHLCGGPRPRVEGCTAARKGRHQARRPGGDARMEHLAPSGGLVRHPRHRRHLSHRQSASVSRTDRLDHQSRRRPRDDDRPHLRAAAGEDRRQVAEHRALHRPHRRGAYAEDNVEECSRIRRLDRRSRRRLHLEKLRRKYCGRHVLHVRHDRTPEGRALFAPLERAARLHGVDAGLQGPCPRATSCCRLCRCSTPTAGRSHFPRRWSAPRW